MQGLVVCAQCQYAFYGKPVSSKAAKGQPREYAYYRCTGSDAYRFGGERVCSNTQVRTDMLDAAVWQEVCTLLANPKRLLAEYERRLEQPQETAGEEVEAQLGKLRGGLSRLIDGYAEGFIERHEFEPRVARLRERMSALETEVQQLQTRSALQAELRLIIGRLEDFAAKVKAGLGEADWATRRELIRTLVRRVEIDRDQVNVVFRVTPDQSPEDQNEEFLQDCWRCDHSTILTNEVFAMHDTPVPLTFDLPTDVLSAFSLTALPSTSCRSLTSAIPGQALSARPLLLTAVLAKLTSYERLKDLSDWARLRAADLNRVLQFGTARHAPSADLEPYLRPRHRSC